MSEAEGLVDVAAATRPKRSEAVDQTAATAAMVAAAEEGPQLNPVWLYEAFNALSTEQQAAKLETGPYCVGENITLEDFEAKVNEMESGGCCRWEFVDGKAWIYELPLNDHEAAGGALVREIVLALGVHSRVVASASSPRCRAGPNRSFEPDGSFTVYAHRPPAGDGRAADAVGNRYPNIIIEVATSETEAHVQARALAWLAQSDDTYGVQQVIVIKVGQANLVGGGHYQTMRALRYERNAANPVQDIEFGINANNNGATQAGMVGMELLIPTASIFQPFPVPTTAPALGAHIAVDLYYVRVAIEDAQ